MLYFGRIVVLKKPLLQDTLCSRSMFTFFRVEIYLENTWDECPESELFDSSVPFANRVEYRIVYLVSSTAWVWSIAHRWAQHGQRRNSPKKMDEGETKSPEYSDEELEKHQILVDTCDYYEDEFADCTSIRARYHQRWVAEQLWELRMGERVDEFTGAYVSTEKSRSARMIESVIFVVFGVFRQIMRLAHRILHIEFDGDALHCIYIREVSNC